MSPAPDSPSSESSFERAPLLDPASEKRLPERRSRRAAVLGGLVLFALAAFLFGAATAVEFNSGRPDDVPDKERPGLSQFRLLDTLSDEQLRLDSGGRLIVVGDIHGMSAPFEELLDLVRYRARNDTVVLSGDMVAKGSSSLPVLRHAISHGALAVRGNHDQKVIEWRAWMDAVRAVPGGKEWIKSGAREKDRPRGALKVPDEWEWESEHWEMAKDMDKERYEWLLSLPVVIRIPLLDLFIVHAGMLPSDPQSKRTYADPPYDKGALRVLDVPQNKPWNMIEMRSVTKRGEPTPDADAGHPWYYLWNGEMDACAAVGAERGCIPQFITYGHAAGRGLNLEAHTFGLDTGCVRGGRLTALIVSSPSTPSPSDSDEEQTTKRRKGKGRGRTRKLRKDADVQVGGAERWKAEVWSVGCEAA